MSHLTVWMTCYGITFVLCDAKLFLRFREGLKAESAFFHDLLGCYFCTGFWVSLVVHLIGLREMIEHRVEYVEGVTLGAFAGATFCYALNSLLLYLEAHDRDPPKD